MLSLQVTRHFGGKCRLYLQGRRISRARNQREAGSKQSSAYSSTLRIEVTCFFETSVDFQRTTTTLYPRRQDSSFVRVIDIVKI
jgi:hypothetical protein